MFFLLGLLGLLIGSFLNVCIYRIPRGESISFPPSKCPTCKERLKPYNLIPLLSYILQAGKCSYCGSPISPRYPLVELINMTLYLVTGSFFSGIDLVLYLIISSLLVVIFFIDLDHMLIPDSLVASVFLVDLFFRVIRLSQSRPSGLKEAFLSAILAGGIFTLIYLLSGGGMGDGDITLIASLAFVLGLKGTLLTIFLSFIYGAVISLGLLALKIKTRKDPIPFGPFIILGFFTSLLYYNEIISLYLRLIAYK